MRFLQKRYHKITAELALWAQRRVLGLFTFNILVMLMIVLRSAGYFDPYFPITINLIVIASFILLIFLLNVRSQFFFIMAIIFLILAGFFRVFLRIDVWAERAALYTFEAFVLGMILVIIEHTNLFKEIQRHG